VPANDSLKGWKIMHLDTPADYRTMIEFGAEAMIVNMPEKFLYLDGFCRGSPGVKP